MTYPDIYCVGAAGISFVSAIGACMWGAHWRQVAFECSQAKIAITRQFNELKGKADSLVVDLGYARSENSALRDELKAANAAAAAARANLYRQRVHPADAAMPHYGIVLPPRGPNGRFLRTKEQAAG
jgi:hypothetical protein